MNPNLPDNVRQLAPGESFQFKCHPGVACFTECCRMLDLALTPYDVLRLSKHLHLTGSAFLDQYAVIEQEEGDSFPQVFLAMVDDGRASCPFVSKDGCAVYADRPGACRTYPLGRGAFRGPDGSQQEIHVLISEPHCKGFGEEHNQSSSEWNDDQELSLYNSINDEMLALLQHPHIINGMRLNESQAGQFIMALYQPDVFRERLAAGNLNPLPQLTEAETKSIATDDLALLRFAIRWLSNALFGE